MQFEYFYGNEAEQFTFYRIPKILITSPMFKKVSDSAKILYGLMLDRMGLSLRNGWVDEQNRAYIYFKTTDVMEYMDCAEGKATKLMQELDTAKGVGLIERIKQGQGKPARIYLKKYITEADNETENSLPSKIAKQDLRKSEVKTCESSKTRLAKIASQDPIKTASQDLLKSQCNNNKYNNTKINNTELNNPSINHMSAVHKTEEIEHNTDTQQNQDRWIDRYNKTIAEVKKQIDYDSLIISNNSEIINNIVSVMTEVLLLDGRYYTIEGKQIPSELVKVNYRKITGNSLEIFLLDFENLYSRIHNPKKYLITALYNIASTADTLITNRVNNDLYGENRYKRRE